MLLAVLLSGSLTVVPAVTRPDNHYRSWNVEIMSTFDGPSRLVWSFGGEHLDADYGVHPNITGLYVGLRYKLIKADRFSIVPATWVGMNGVQYGPGLDDRSPWKENEGWFPYVRPGLMGRIDLVRFLTIEGGPTWEWSSYDFGSRHGFGWRLGLAITP